MRVAYADPPYFGLAEKFYGHLHPEAARYDTLGGVGDERPRLLRPWNGECTCGMLAYRAALAEKGTGDGQAADG